MREQEFGRFGRSIVQEIARNEVYIHLYKYNIMKNEQYLQICTLGR